MITGIGCDIVQHEVTSKLGWDKKPRVLLENFLSTRKEDKLIKRE